MRTFFALWRRELAACFLSPIAYVMLMFFLLVTGCGFYWLVKEHLGVMHAAQGLMVVIWACMLIVLPIITMRAFAEERRSGTFETLMTAPVRNAAVVLGLDLRSLCSGYADHGQGRIPIHEKSHRLGPEPVANVFLVDLALLFDRLGGENLLDPGADAGDAIDVDVHHPGQGAAGAPEEERSPLAAEVLDLFVPVLPGPIGE